MAGTMLLTPGAGCMTAGAEGENVELDVWVRDTYYDTVTIAAEKYMEQNPNVQITVTQPEDMSDQFALALSSGDTPDIVSMDCVLVPFYSSIGAFEDITEEFAALEYKDAFSEGMIRLSTYEDVQYAIPFGPDVSVLLYNKEHFREAGLDPEKGPATWDELIEYAQKLTTDDRYGYVCAAADAGGMMFTFVPYIWNNYGDVMSEDGSQSTLDQPEAIGGLQLLCDMVNEYKVTPDGITTYDWTGSKDAFTNGTASMVVLGSGAVWEFLTSENDKVDMGICLIPSSDGKEYASFSGGDSMAIVQGCENKEAAWSFIQFCLSEDIQVEEMAKFGMIPARSDLFDNEYFNANPEFQVLEEALEVGRAPYSLKYNEMYVPFLDGLQYALNGEKTAEEAFTEAAQQINAILAE